jgi:hypothetical protein
MGWPDGYEQLAILNVFQATKPTIAHQYANL